MPPIFQWFFGASYAPVMWLAAAAASYVVLARARLTKPKSGWLDRSWRYWRLTAWLLLTGTLHPPLTKAVMSALYVPIMLLSEIDWPLGPASSWVEVSFAPSMLALIAMENLAWLVLLAVVTRFLDRGGKSAISRLLGSAPGFLLRVVAGAAVASLAIWPLELPGRLLAATASLQLSAQVYALAGLRFAQGGSFSQAGQPFALSAPPVWVSAASLVGLVVAYAVGAWMAYRIIDELVDWSDQCPSWLQGGWPRFVAWLTLAGALAIGITHLVELIVSTGRQLQLVFGSQSHSLGLDALWAAAPFLAYPVAGAMLLRIDWEAMRDEFGWWPSDRQQRLFFLTMAAWLAWPFSAVQSLLAMR